MCSNPELLEGSPPYDVVFCRNLLIYLDGPARACVLAANRPLLAADGLLFIGHADRLDWPGAELEFTAVGDPGCFAYQRTGRRVGSDHAFQPPLEPPPAVSQWFARPHPPPIT